MIGNGGMESLAEAPRASTKPGTLLVGTAGFHYPDWIGPVFPPGAGRGGRPHPLSLLSRWVDLLEVNVSFYRIPSPEMATGWLSRTAARPGFRFTAKLWRGFTHGPERATRGDLAAYRRFLRALEADGRLDAVLVQLPPSFRATTRSEAYVRRLRDHLEGRPLAVEPRDASWDRDEVRASFRDAGIAWVVADLPPGPRSVPPDDHVTAPLAYVRLHGRSPDWYVPRVGRDRRYDHLYGPDEVRAFAERIAALRRRAERVVVVANNHPSGKALVNAIELRAASGVPESLAPASLIAAYPRLAAVATADPLDPRASPRVDGADPGCFNLGEPPP